MTALELAVKFHETYERLAPSFGYETRTDTRTFDPDSKNGRLMVAVCAELSGDCLYDAHLVAAAPDLLDACIQAEAVLSIVEPRSDKAEYLRVLGTLRIALSKARGPQ